MQIRRIFRILLPLVGAASAALAADQDALIVTASNAANNQLLVYNPAGQLVQTLATKGQGGASGNAGGIEVDGSVVAVVNYGSNNVSLFERIGDGLHLAQVVPTVAKPVSVAFGSGHLYVLGAMPVVRQFDHHPGHEKAPLEEEYRSDDCLWLFNAIPAYVKETGNLDFYRKILPYADQGEDTVLGHMKRAIQFNLERSGAHELPCGLSADWNDCIRLGQQGESIFVAFQLRYALRVQP